MALQYITGRQIELTTEFGKFWVTFTNGTHAYADIRGHVNAVDNCFTYRGGEYIGSAHLFAPEWEPRPGREGNSDVSIIKRPSWIDAPRTYRAAMVRAMTDAVSSYVQEHPDVLREAEYIDANNALYHLVGERNTLQKEIDKKDAEIRSAQQRMSRNAPKE